MSKDILLYENGTGGELLILNNDISLVETLYQQVYLRLFGGQLEANTKGNEKEGEQRFDWWGNQLLFNNEKDKQFNSNTERVLDNVVLNSSGRIDIIRAVKSDLKNLKKIADISINALILTHSRIKISILLQKPEIEEEKIFQFIWDNARKEVIIEKNL